VLFDTPSSSGFSSAFSHFQVWAPDYFDPGCEGNPEAVDKSGPLGYFAMQSEFG
jgi:hypothetical protein